MSIGLTNHGTISTKKRIHWETQLFALTRSFSDGITFFNFKVNLDRYIDDHSPSFQIEFTIFNLYFHLWVYQNNYVQQAIDVIDDAEYENMCSNLKFFGISVDELDNLATDYLEQGVSAYLCYKLAYKDILKSRKIDE